MKEISRYLTLSGLAASVLFFISILSLSLFFPGYSHLDNYISELGAVDSPVQVYMNIFGFFVPGVLFLVFSVVLYNVMKTNVIGKLGVLFFVFFALLFTSIAFFPCDAGCINISPTGELHEFTSDYALYSGLISLYLFSYSSKISQKDYNLKRYWKLTSLVATTSLMFGYGYLFVDGLPFPGLIQRITILIPFVFLAYASLSLYDEEPLVIQSYSRHL